MDLLAYWKPVTCGMSSYTEISGLSNIRHRKTLHAKVTFKEIEKMPTIAHTYTPVIEGTTMDL